MKDTKKILIVLLFLLFTKNILGQKFESKNLNLYVATSLKDWTLEVIELYKKSYNSSLREMEFKINSQGSQILKLQILNGARADIFLSADIDYIEDLITAKIVDKNYYGILCKNKMVIVIKNSSLQKIHSIFDISKSDIKIILGTASSPFGRYARKIIDKVTAEQSDFKDRVKKNVISYETNVSKALAKIKLEFADVAFVYKSDVALYKDELIIKEIDNRFQADIEYGYGVIDKSAFKKEALDFIAFLKTKPIQNLLIKYGFKGL